MTPQQAQTLCTHAPYYQKGCLSCSVRYVKFLRPSREKQEAYLSGLSEKDAGMVKEALKQEKDA